MNVSKPVFSPFTQGSTRPHHSPRRDFVTALSQIPATLALTSLLSQEALSEEQVVASQETQGDESHVKEADSASSLRPRKAHFKSKAVSCIFLMMEGGPSHIDTFDPKPALDRLHLSEFVREGKTKSAMESGRRYYVRSPFRFRKTGDSGADMAENWHYLAEVADQLCFFRGCQVSSVNHPTAMYQMNCGNQFGGDPSIGAWVTYGLGSVNQNLPGFIVLPEVSWPQGGAPNWGNGFLPALFQGTPLRTAGKPILDLSPPRGVTSVQQRRNLDLLARLNESHLSSRADSSELLARMAAYELAWKMQTEVPGLVQLDQETEMTQRMYGIGNVETDSFGRKCLMARRLVEKGVRFVQLYHGSWDSHDYIERAHGNLIQSVDQPIAALIRDLGERGLLESTLIVWCGEFGRTPDNGVRGGTAYGRDHNPNAMTIWMAGGGCRAGSTIGATDELGMTAVEGVAHVRDFHVTLLRLLGLDDNRLTYYHAGRFKQLSQFGGQIIDDLLD